VKGIKGNKYARRYLPRYQKIILAFSRKGEVLESERERWKRVERMGRERGGEGDEAREWGRRSKGKREEEEMTG
jgi:hypothetical protein